MADLMSAEQMLVELHEYGDQNDYNDADAVEGWFSWRVDGDVLSVTHEVDDSAAAANPDVTRRWRLVPIEAS